MSRDAGRRSAHADWPLDVLRAPVSGQAFKLNKQGRKPQPAPKFRFEATPAVDAPEGTVRVLFLTAGGKECGLGSARSPISFTANAARTIDIPNDSIVVGPEACGVEGVSCTPSQCKLPLTTTKMRIVFGDGDRDVGQATESVQYKWTKPPSGGGGGGGGGGALLSCKGISMVPDTVNCGVPTALCVDGTYTCSSSDLACWSHGNVACYVCPGPICPYTCPGPYCP